MALFRKFFYRKPPDGLLEISERVYVFDCCFTTDVLEEQEYNVYIRGIVAQLREHFPEASFMVFNFREGEQQSQLAGILSEYDTTVMDYPRHYEGCPLLTMEMIHHFLRSSESWLSLGQQNILLMHCERGGWPVLSFMLAGLLLYRKQYTGEQRTLDMIYKQAPRELLQLLSPLNPVPSQLRYLQYISRRNVGSEWPPLDRALTLDCVILRILPKFDGGGGCRPIFRIYGQDPFIASDKTPKVLFSTSKRSKSVRLYKPDCELIKIDIHCHIQGDVVLECISLDEDLEREEMMFRVMFNTAFIRSNILMLNRDEIDILWDAKDRFSKDFRAEVLLSEMDSASSDITMELASIEDKEGLPVEAFAKVHEIFSNVDWSDVKGDAALHVLQHIASSNALQVKLESASPKKLEEDTALHVLQHIASSNALQAKLESFSPEQMEEDAALYVLQHIASSNALQAKLESTSPEKIEDDGALHVLQHIVPLKALQPKSEATSGKKIEDAAVQVFQHISPSNALQDKSEATTTKKIEDAALQVLQHIASLNASQAKLESTSPNNIESEARSEKSSSDVVKKKLHPRKVVDLTNKPLAPSPKQQPTHVPMHPPDPSTKSQTIQHHDLQAALQHPSLPKIVTQSISKSRSYPASFSNSLQGSSTPVSRYHSAPSALGITALLHDQAAFGSSEITHSVTMPQLTSSLSSGYISSLYEPVKPKIASPPPSPALPSPLPYSASTKPKVSTSPTPPPPPPPSTSSSSTASVLTVTSPPPPPPPPPPPSTTVSTVTSTAIAMQPLASSPPPAPSVPPKSVLKAPTITSPTSASTMPATPPQLTQDMPPSKPEAQLLSANYLKDAAPSLKGLPSTVPPSPPPPPHLGTPLPRGSPRRDTSDPFSPTYSLPSGKNVSVQLATPPPPPPPSGMPLLTGSPTHTSHTQSLPSGNNISVNLANPPRPPPPPPPMASPSTSYPPPSPKKKEVGHPPHPPPMVSQLTPHHPPSPRKKAVAIPPPPPPPPMVSPSTTHPPSPTKKAVGTPHPPAPPPRSSGTPPAVTGSAPPPPPPPQLSTSQKSSNAPPVPPPPSLKGSDGASSQSSALGSKGAPPPPANGMGAPAFPLGMKGRSLTRTSPRSSSAKRTNLKPLHWVKVTRAMQGSLWAETQKSDEASKAPEFDMSELESLFSAAVPNSDTRKASDKSSGRSSLGQKSDRVQLIDLRRANNCEIMLTKVKMPLSDLLSSLLALDDSVLDIDQIDNLIKFCPTKEEMDLLKGFNGDKETLGKCEQYFLELMKVPRVESKLRVFSFKIQFRSQVGDLSSNLNTVNSASAEIRNSVKLRRTMQTILSLGNALNQGTARGSAVGFRLDSLLKLTDTRARNNKMTLMHYLCKVLAEKLPELLDFPKDLVSLEAASKMQLKTLAEEMQAISKGLEKVEQELTASENDGPISEIFHKTLKEFLVVAEAEVRTLTSLYSSVGRNADALALYFGEDPSRCPFEQVVTTLLNFMKMFIRAHEENCKQLELEKKKAQKEAENEKIKLAAAKKELDSLSRSSAAKNVNTK